MRTGRPASPPLPHQGHVLVGAFSPDGKRILTGSADQTARVWDAAGSKPIGPPMLHPKPVQAVGWNSDGRLVVTTAAGLSRRWQAATGAAVGNPFAFAEAGLFLADGRVLVAPLAPGLNTTGVLDAVTGKAAGPPVPVSGMVNALTLSPDGRTLLTGSSDSVGRLWDVATGKLAAPPLQHQTQVYHTIYGPDGRCVLTGDYKGKFRLWDAATGVPVGSILSTRAGTDPGHVGFSPDGAIVWSRDGQAFRLWDAATGKPLGPPLTHPGALQLVALTIDNRFVRTVGADGTIRRWDVAPLPLPGKAAQITFWVQTITGLQLDAAGVAAGWIPTPGRRFDSDCKRRVDHRVRPGSRILSKPFAATLEDLGEDNSEVPVSSKERMEGTRLLSGNEPRSLYRSETDV